MIVNTQTIYGLTNDASNSSQVAVPSGGGLVALSGEISTDAADFILGQVFAQSASGSPTSGTLTIKWQCSPRAWGGRSIDQQSTTEQKPWFDVIMGGPNAWLLPDGDWPVINVSDIGGAGSMPMRRIRGAFPGHVRLVGTVALTGGSTPYLNLSTAFVL